MTEFSITLVLEGQCPSGKNAVIVTRTGHRYPSARFVEWRQDAINQLIPQLRDIKKNLPITFPVTVEIDYTAKDRIRRDKPGIEDALWHLLEKMEVVSDDTFLGGWGEDSIFHNHGVDKANAGVKIQIRGNYASALPVRKKQFRARTKRKPKRTNVSKIRGLRKKTMDDGNT